MKNLILSAAALLLAVGVSAQGEFNVPKGTIGVTGGLGLGNWSNGDSDGSVTDSNFDVCLGALYSFSDAWAGGLMLEYGSTNSETQGVDGSSSTSNLLVGPYGRRYFPCGGGLNTYVGAEVGFGNNTSTFDDGTSSSESSTSVLDAGLNFGLQYKFNEKVALEMNFGGVNYTSWQSDVEGADPVTSFDFNAFSKGLEVGFMWFAF